MTPRTANNKLGRHSQDSNEGRQRTTYRYVPAGERNSPVRAPGFGLDRERKGLASGREQNEDELDRLVAEWTSGRAGEDVMTNFQSDGVSSGNVLNWEGLVNNPQLGHRGYHVKLIGSDLGVYHVPNWGIRLSDTPPAYRLEAPISGSTPNSSAAASWECLTRSSLSCWPTSPSNNHSRLATL